MPRKNPAEKLQAKGNAVDFKELLRMEPDGGTTNIRNVKSKHWTRWLERSGRKPFGYLDRMELHVAPGISLDLRDV